MAIKFKSSVNESTNDNEKRGRLSELSKKLQTLNKQKKDLERSNPKVFEKWNDLQDEMEGIKETLKIEARKFSVEGSNEILWDTSDLLVSVSGRKRPVTYDYSIAKELLDPSVFEAICVKEIDSKKVESIVTSGILSDDNKSAIEMSKKLGDLPTPAVTLKCL